MAPLAVALAVACLALVATVVRLRHQALASRSAFDALATRAPMGILRADRQGMCTFANDTWCQISGLSREATLGRAWSQAVHPDDLAGTMAKWEQSVHERLPYSHELRLLRPDGTVRHVLAGACPTHDAEGRLTGFVGTVLDVTHRLDAERVAREKDALLRTLADHSPAAIYLKDLAGRYLLMNRSHVDLWPALAAFRPGTTPFDWFPEETARSFMASDAAVIRTGEKLTFEEAIPMDGGPRTFLTTKFPVFDDAGGVVGVGGISADISALEEARREIAVRERLLRNLIDVQEAEKRLLCHEFHDGLIQYAVGSKMLLESLRDADLPPACVPAVDTVIECLANGIEDGRRVIRGIRPAALDDLGLRAAIEDLAADVRASGVAIDVKLDDGIDALSAPLQTTAYRVVQESLNNARKHSGTDRVRVGVCRTDDALRIEVEDFGRGFEPTSTSWRGFGIVGLRERVRLAGGECRIDTGPGRGTTVSVRLPLAAASAAPERGTAGTT